MLDANEKLRQPAIARTPSNFVGEPINSLRRAVVMVAGLAALPTATKAQTTVKTAKVGWLIPGGTTPEDQTRYEQRLEGRFRDLGWHKGKNLVIEMRLFGGDPVRLKKSAAELVAVNCDVIMAGENFALAALLEAGAKMPIVVQVGNNLAELKLVASYASPGGNVTGLVADQSEEIIAKGFDLLRQLVPGLQRVGNTWASNVPGHMIYNASAERAVARLGLAYTRVEVNDPGEIEPAFAKLAAAGSEAVYVGGSTVSYTHMQRFIDSARRHRMADMTVFKLAAESGALASYGADIEDLILRSTGYVDKILRGAKPSDLPIQQPTKYEFVINLRRARELGLKIPNAVLLQADKVIE